MKVAIVCPYDLSATGGVQQLCVELAQRLRDVGDNVILAGPGSGDWVSLGPTVSVTANGSRVPISLSRSVGRTLEQVMGDVDVVHLHEPLIPRVGWATLRRTVPMVLTFHADPPMWARRLYTAAPVVGVMRNHVKTAVSPVARSAVPPSWGEVEVIPNAIDVGSYALDVPRRPGRVAFLGRDDPRKGLSVLLEAWPAITAVHPDAELIVIGASRTSGPPGVRFVGRVSDAEKRELLRSSAVFAAPNAGGESFGIVVAEAMAAGCAVVASDLPAFRDVAGDCASYVAPGHADAWAVTITGLLASPERLASLGRLAAGLAVRFDWPGVIRRYRNAYALSVESA